jgi:hypothetical protein
MTEPSNNENPVSEPSENRWEKMPVARRLKDKTGEKVKGGLAKLWSTGGGGFYGLGYLLTFLWYHVRLRIVGSRGTSPELGDLHLLRASANCGLPWHRP